MTKQILNRLPRKTTKSRDRDLAATITPLSTSSSSSSRSGDMLSGKVKSPGSQAPAILNSAARLRMAANEKAEAEKIIQIKRDEGEAEDKYLSSFGMVLELF